MVYLSLPLFLSLSFSIPLPLPLHLSQSLNPLPRSAPLIQPLASPLYPITIYTILPRHTSPLYLSSPLPLPQILQLWSKFACLLAPSIIDYSLDFTAAYIGEFLDNSKTYRCNGTTTGDSTGNDKKLRDALRFLHENHGNGSVLEWIRFLFPGLLFLWVLLALFHPLADRFKKSCGVAFIRHAILYASLLICAIVTIVR